MKLAQQPDASHRRIGMQLLRGIVEHVGITYSAQFMNIEKIFLNGVLDNDKEVSRRATLAMVALLDMISSEEQVQIFTQEVIPVMIKKLQTSLESKDFESAYAIFEILDDCANRSYNVLSDNAAIISTMLTVLKPFFDPELRDKAANFLCTLLRQKPGQFTKNNFAVPLLEISMSMLAEDCELDNVEENSPLALGGELLDTLAANIPPVIIFDLLLQNVLNLVKSTNYLQRRSGYSSLATVVEYCVEFLVPHVDNIIPMICQGMLDENPVVRASAATCLMHFAEYITDLTIVHHKSVIPGLLSCITNESNLLVKERLITGLSVFCGYINKDINIYIESIMKLSIELFNSIPNMKVKVAALSCIKACASAAYDKFISYSANVIELCFNIMSNSNDDVLELRCMATEVLGSVAFAIGYENFQQCIAQSMQLVSQGMSLDYFDLRSAGFIFYGYIADSWKEHLPQECIDIMIDFALKEALSDDGVQIKNQKHLHK